MSQSVPYHIPTRPFSPIDALNRRAAAVGSPGYAMAASHANYNGHHINVWWNDYRKYYIAEYYWAGRRVLARGSFQDCLNAAIAEFNRGALGCSVAVNPRADDAEAIALCEAIALVVKGAEPRDLPWWTWRHTVASGCVRDAAHPGMPATIFDWELMQQAQSDTQYYNLLKTKYGLTYR